VGGSVDVNGVFGALAQQLAAVLAQMADEIGVLQWKETAIGSWMILCPAWVSLARERLASISNSTASRKFSRASSSESPG
jgi:hypothetical protein